MTLWFYDLRTNKHFTLKTRTLKLDDLQDFIACYHPENRHERKESERLKYYRYEDLIARDKASLDIFWLKDKSLDELAVVQAAGRQPHADVVMHEHLHAVGSAVGEQIHVVRPHGAEHSHDPCERSLAARTQVQRLDCHPHGIDADHRSSPRVMSVATGADTGLGNDNRTNLGPGGALLASSSRAGVQCSPVRSRCRSRPP